MHTDGRTSNLPKDPAELIALVQKQQAQLASSEKRNERLQKKLQSKDSKYREARRTTPSVVGLFKR